MTETANIHGTDGDCLTEVLPDFRMEDTRRLLIAARLIVGADTPRGHRYSNLIEQIDAFAKASTERYEIAKLIDRTMAELRGLQ